jgi:hypothetical protein
MVTLLAGLMAASCATQMENQKAVPSATQPSTSHPRSLTAQQLNATSQTKLSVTYAKLPLYFEPNQGQTAEQVHFLARGRGYTLFLTSTEAVLALRTPRKNSRNSLSPISRERTWVRGTDPEPSEQTGVRMQLVGANPIPRVAGREKLPGIVNYFVGNDPTKWCTDIPTYAKVKYQDVYPGVDLVYYGNQRQLEYDFIISPGADPKAIRLGFDGLVGTQRAIPKTDINGDLILDVKGGKVRLHKPLVYQEINGVRQEISGRYISLQPGTPNPHAPNSELISSEPREVGFEVAAYDTSKPLIIDPVLSYATYLGGSGSDYTNPYNNIGGNGIAVDAAGNVYMTGSTTSADFPTTLGTFDTSSNRFTSSGYTDAFVVKLNAAGTALVYATYLGSSAQVSSSGADIAVDGQGNAYVVGDTGAGSFNPGFPTTPGAFDTEYGPNSRIEYNDSFVTKLNSTGSALVYSTYLGGIFYDYVRGIAVDNQGNAYVTGLTTSMNFPTTPGALDTTTRDSFNRFYAFVTKLNTTGSALVYSTYLGGISLNGLEEGTDISVDDEGNAYVVGNTGSTDFPVTPGAFDTSLGTSSQGITYQDAFVAKLNPTGSALVYSTYLGGSGGETGLGITVDASGSVYVTGSTASTDFPTTPGALQSTLHGVDAFITKFSPAGSALIYSTYLGGSNDDQGNGITVGVSGSVYVTGGTVSPDFPVTVGAAQVNYGDNGDAFVTWLNPTGSTLVYSTYLGGSIGSTGQSAFDTGTGVGLDGAGNVYVVG